MFKGLKKRIGNWWNGGNSSPQGESKPRKTEIKGKNFHITIHKIPGGDLDFWLQRAWNLKTNPRGAMVALENSHDLKKGHHAHILIQFTTRQSLSRRQLVNHFETDSLNIALKTTEISLKSALGYVAKTRNYVSKGYFLWGSKELSLDPLVTRFCYEVRDKDSAIQFFNDYLRSMILDHGYVDGDLIKRKLRLRNDSISVYLQGHPTLSRTLEIQELIYLNEHLSSQKRLLEFHDWAYDRERLRKQYLCYLKMFPVYFRAFKQRDSEINLLELERDYDQHVDQELSTIRRLVGFVDEAKAYGPKRPHKSTNPFIWSGQPNFGKTRFLDTLSKYLPSFRLPDDQYYLDFESNRFYLLISDEAFSFLKSKDYAHLKKLFEGKPVEFNRKSHTKIVRQDNPLVILAENMSFDLCMSRIFKFQYSREVMASRVVDLEIRSRATLHFIIDRVIASKP